MKKLMKSRKFEDYKKNEVSAPWAILGGEWVSTGYYDENNTLNFDIADKTSYDEITHIYLPKDVKPAPAPPIVG